MIPITLAVLGNHSNERTRLQNFVTSCVYVLRDSNNIFFDGTLGGFDRKRFRCDIGKSICTDRDLRDFLTMALSMYGLFELQVPTYIRNRFGSGKPTKSLGGAYFTGLFAGIVASPCVGPVLVAILTYVASTQNKWLGFLFLFFYALGLGLIFIAMGLSNQLLKALPRSGPWMNGFKFILGTLMLSAFYYYLDLLMPERGFDLALGAGLIALGSIYGAFLPVKSVSALNHLRKGSMLAVLIVGIVYVGLSAFDLRPYIRQSHGGRKQSQSDPTAELAALF